MSPGTVLRLRGKGEHLEYGFARIAQVWHGKPARCVSIWRGWESYPGVSGVVMKNLENQVLVGPPLQNREMEVGWVGRGDV